VGFIGICRLVDWQRSKPYGIRDIVINQRRRALPILKLLSCSLLTANGFTNKPSRFAASACTMTGFSHPVPSKEKGDTFTFRLLR
jgi:hypothetical protein